ncbi:DUF6520 family protein [Gelidibacter mesophilus]|uniref:DUF6520 family protein n=1 Tax=Gelidibacter mesophilus TaxID=169050 RepID=UPI000482D867|nr:DUF6520 family protein [Gelidibacter mesophilus]
MKTKFLRSILPAFVFMLAVVSAFAFKGIEEKALLAPETGWINLPGTPCTVAVECDNNPLLEEVCTVIYNGVRHQAFGKQDPSSMNCARVLYKLQP